VFGFPSHAKGRPKGGDGNAYKPSWDSLGLENGWPSSTRLCKVGTRESDLDQWVISTCLLTFRWWKYLTQPPWASVFIPSRQSTLLARGCSIDLLQRCSPLLSIARPDNQPIGNPPRCNGHFPAALRAAIVSRRSARKFPCYRRGGHVRAAIAYHIAPLCVNKMRRQWLACIR